MLTGQKTVFCPVLRPVKQQTLIHHQETQNSSQEEKEREEKMNRRKRTIKTKKETKTMLDTKIATWNIHGKLADNLHQELLERDMITKSIDICCIQETRMNQDAEIQCSKGVVIINLKADSDNAYKRYGMVFYV